MLESEETAKIALYAALWGVLLIAELWQLSRRNTVGLPFAFLLLFTVMHGGALVHLVDGYSHYDNAYLSSLRYSRSTVADGFEASFLAMLAASVGFMVGDATIKRNAGPLRANFTLERLKRGSLVVLGIGLAAFVIERLANDLNVPLAGFQAAFSSARNLFAVGGCGLILHDYLSGKRAMALALTVAFAAALPATFLLSTAILADSVAIAIAIFAFYLTLRTRKGRPFIRNVGLFAFVSLAMIVFSAGYLQSRSLLRDLLWESGGDAASAAGVVAQEAQAFDVNSVMEQSSLSQIDARLNQNIYIGLAIEQLAILPDTYENGKTIMLALLAWVPRALWPNKPERGGASMIEKHTTKKSAEGVTFGAGPIFEFYVNFGYWGIIVGFVIVGYVLRLLDLRAAEALQQADVLRSAQFHLTGLAMLQPLSELFFIVTSAASAFLLVAAMRYYWNRRTPVLRPR